MKKFCSLFFILCIGLFFSGCGVKWEKFNPYQKHHSKQHYPKPAIGTKPTMTQSFNTHAAGEAYLQACHCSMAANMYSQCPDYTEEEIEKIKNEDGNGYRDGKWAGENIPEIQD